MSKERVTLRAGITTLLAAGVAIYVVTVMPAAAQTTGLLLLPGDGTGILRPGSKIAFHGDREGRDAPDEIYVMSGEGKGAAAVEPPRRVILTTHECNAINPRWSPNGRQIAYHCFTAASSEIYLINADGTEINPDPETGLTPLTKVSTPAFRGAAFASWSPNGKKIAFTNALPPMNIYVLDVDDCIAAPCGPLAVTPLIRGANRPDWSPDGRKLVFHRGPRASAQIYVADINDPDVAVQLTFTGGANRNPRWSPNGSKITFESTRDGNPNDNAEIYVMNADGSDQLRLTDSPNAPNTVPSFSPDGHWIVFHRQVIPDPDPPNGSDLFAVPVDRSVEAVNLTNQAQASFSSFASWAPGHDAVTPTH